MEQPSIEKLGSFGALIAATACPICFPKVALVGSAVGLGAFAPYEGLVAKAVQGLFLLAFIGQFLAFPEHRNRWLLALSASTTLLLFAAYYILPSSILLQLSLVGLAAASVWPIVEQRRCAKCPPNARSQDY